MARLAEPSLASQSQALSGSGQPSIVSMDSVPDGSRTLAGMLLAAAMAALLGVADQIINSWTDGHLLAAWVALWTIAFAALALLATPLRQMAAFLSTKICRQLAGRRAMREVTRT